MPNSRLRVKFESMSLAEIKSAVDQLSVQDAEHIARALSSVNLRESGAGHIPRRVDFLDLYAVRDVQELPRKIEAREPPLKLRALLKRPVAPKWDKA